MRKASNRGKYTQVKTKILAILETDLKGDLLISKRKILGSLGNLVQCFESVVKSRGNLESLFEEKQDEEALKTVDIEFEDDFCEVESQAEEFLKASDRVSLTRSQLREEVIRNENEIFKVSKQLEETFAAIDKDLNSKQAASREDVLPSRGEGYQGRNENRL